MKCGGSKSTTYIYGIKLISMNKKEIKNAITKDVCAFVTNLGYSIDDDGFHGSLTFQRHGSSIDDSIEWNRSYQDAVCLNWASDQTKLDVQAINAYMGPRIEWWNAQYQPKRAVA
jgi:hypothetical protein